MKRILKSFVPLCVCVAFAFCPSDAFAKKKKIPDFTHDGLERVNKPKSKADVVYVLPDADLSDYKRVIILEPHIAFQKNWRQDINSQRTIDRISEADMEGMIERGKKYFMEQFTKVLEKKGYPVVHAAEGDVLLVRPAIVDLEVFAPDPDRTAGAWKKVYTENAGEATLMIELYDSVTGQIIARALDHREFGEQFGWYQPRDQFTNINDARQVFSNWANMLARGLDDATGK